MKGIVDRLEGEYFVIEIDGATQDVERSKVSGDVITGDVVTLIDGTWVRDVSETEKRRAEIKKLMDSVWED